MIYEKFRSELSDEQSNFIENHMEIVDHAHFQDCLLYTSDAADD